MKYRITASHAQSCRINLPASKSISNRALIIGALARCTRQITHLARCDDTQVLLSALSSDNTVTDIHGAGTAMRFLTAYYSCTPGRHTLTGSSRMQQRPIAPLVEALQQAGACISYTRQEGFPPLLIEGRTLHGGCISLPGNISSQYISAILMVAPYMTHGLQLTITGKILSRPYIDMTIAAMRHYGARVTHTDNTITVQPLPYRPGSLRVESDWSAAAYWYELCYLNGATYHLAGLSDYTDDTGTTIKQGDAKVAEYYKKLGIKTTYDDTGITIAPQEKHTAPDCLTLNLKDNPDLAQSIIIGCLLKGQHFSICGLDNLHIKECNRIEALIDEARRLGYILTLARQDCIEWHGKRCNVQYPIEIKTYDDHRMAMALTPAALYHDEIWIDNPQVVDKSYPAFWQEMQHAGINLTKHPSPQTSTP